MRVAKEAISQTKLTATTRSRLSQSETAVTILGTAVRIKWLSSINKAQQWCRPNSRWCTCGLNGCLTSWSPPNRLIWRNKCKIATISPQSTKLLKAATMKRLLPLLLIISRLVWSPDLIAWVLAKVRWGSRQSSLFTKSLLYRVKVWRSPSWCLTRSLYVLVQVRKRASLNASDVTLCKTKVLFELKPSACASFAHPKRCLKVRIHVVNNKTYTSDR